MTKAARAFAALERELCAAFARLDFAGVQLAERDARCETLEARVKQLQHRAHAEAAAHLKALADKDEHRRLLVVNARKLKEKSDEQVNELTAELGVRNEYLRKSKEKVLSLSDEREVLRAQVLPDCSLIAT